MSKRILIVEDEKNIVDILSFNLGKEGYETLEAYDGEAGLELARSARPDLILLDVMLPKMIGFDVCKALRESGSGVKVVVGGAVLTQEYADSIDADCYARDAMATVRYAKEVYGTEEKA